MYCIRILNNDEEFSCIENSSVLQSMKSLNRKGIPVGCRGGGCGICRIQIQQGQFKKKRMSRAHISELDEQHGIVLACCIYPRSDLEITVLGLKQIDKKKEIENE
ncbi:2Fe-2S iron-sulfur cluster-binding protein [Acinetobacter sichuanensis]|uniref:2Fe-2S iron-sulfur cluster-binding protein n=1 Tax=Acinetobacter sichuanensis TaxID=2136183 RepID=A0A371YR11_9GAMM|nr:2Fe-2S iron-sulfur cluster-binding protein [Acinetobacter sichuanensis]RFC83898.1 ferredoxin [Acinetobacter sichuanensis]